MKIYVIRRSNKRGPTKTNDVPLELRSPPTKFTKNSEEHTDDEDLIKPASDQFDNWSDTSNVDSGCETELLWGAEVVGFRSSDPVRIVSAYLVATAGWAQRSRTLGSFRYCLETALIRAGVPRDLASSFIGHEVADYDNKKGNVLRYLSSITHDVADLERGGGEERRKTSKNEF